LQPIYKHIINNYECMHNLYYITNNEFTFSESVSKRHDLSREKSLKHKPSKPSIKSAKKKEKR